MASNKYFYFICFLIFSAAAILSKTKAQIATGINSDWLKLIIFFVNVLLINVLLMMDHF